MRKRDIPFLRRTKKRNSTNTGGSKSSKNSPHDETVSANIIPDSAEKSTENAKKCLSGNGQVLNVKSDASPQPTSETLLDGITATDSIIEKSQIVNSNSKKTPPTVRQI